MKVSSSVAIVASAASVLTTSSAFTTTTNVNTARTTTSLKATDDDENNNNKSDNGLWGPPPDQKDGNKSGEMSQALPFVPRPKLLDGSLAADVGFDPFGFAGADKESLLYMREAEIKHSRLAMLAVVAWPLQELFDKPLADAIGRPDLLGAGGRSPSLLNGGLDKIELEYWVFVVALAGLVELSNNEQIEKLGKNYIPGDCNFDPLNLFPSDVKGKKEMQTKEIKHGRLAMIALLGFVVQEALYGIPVVQETPFFFTPLF